MKTISVVCITLYNWHWEVSRTKRKPHIWIFLTTLPLLFPVKTSVKQLLLSCLNSPSFIVFPRPADRLIYMSPRFAFLVFKKSPWTHHGLLPPSPGHAPRAFWANSITLSDFPSDVIIPFPSWSEVALERVRARLRADWYGQVVIQPRPVTWA